MPKLHPNSPTSTELEALLDELEALRRAAERHRIAAAHSDEIILDYDLLSDCILHTTDLVEALYGLPQRLENALETLASSGVVLPESVPGLIEAVGKVRDGAPSVHYIVRTRIVTGALRWNRLVLTTVFDETGRAVRAVGLLQDITLQREAELRYENELLYRDTMARNAVLTYEVDLTKRRLLTGHEHLDGLAVDPTTLDYDDALRLLVGRMLHPEDRSVLLTGMNVRSLLQQHALGRDKLEFEYRRLLPEGGYSWARGTVYLTDDRQAGSVRAFFYVQDIHRAKLELLRLRDEAERDLLTGLYNKITTERLVSEAIALEPRSGGTVGALIMVDLDNFKRANDQLGHAFGDALLAETAQKLRALCRRDDVAGRIGGDEFALYLRTLPDAETARRKAEEICALFEHDYSAALGDYAVSGSVGVALVPDHGDSFELLYRRADQALYEAKAAGKNTVRFYSGTEADVSALRPINAIDQANGKRFSSNIVDYVLRILYESRDLRRATDGVLELVSKHFGFSRGYLYELTPDGRSCELSMEWCAPQVKPLPETLRRLSGRELERCQSQLMARDTADAGELTAPTSAHFPPLPQLRARLQQALTFEGKFAGFVGFDRYTNSGEPSGKRPTALREVAQLLDIFLSEQLAHRRMAEQRAILDALPAAAALCCAYAIDAATCTLRFVDPALRRLLPDLPTSAPCHRLLRGKATPCDDCPLEKMLAENLSELHTELFLAPYQRTVQLKFELLRLEDGRTLALVTGRDAPRNPA